MSEPITIYCVTAHEWAARHFQPGDAMTLYAPSFVRDMLASGRWSFDAPVPALPPVPVEVPVEAPVPVPVQPAPKRKPRRL